MNWVAAGSGLTLVALSALTLVDVVGRKFNAPISGGLDISSMMLTVVVATSVAYSGLTGGQVGIELLTDRLSGRAACRLEVLAKAMSAAMVALLAGSFWHDAYGAWELGMVTNLLRIPLYPFYSVLGAGMMLYVLVLGCEGVAAWRRR